MGRVANGINNRPSSLLATGWYWLLDLALQLHQSSPTSQNTKGERFRIRLFKLSANH